MTQLPEQASQFVQLYTVFVFIARVIWLGSGDLAALCAHQLRRPPLPLLRQPVPLCLHDWPLPLPADSPASALIATLENLVGSPSAGARHTRRTRGFFLGGGEVLPKMDEEEEDAAALAAAAAAVWHNQQLAQRKRRWV